MCGCVYVCTCVYVCMYALEYQCVWLKVVRVCPCRSHTLQPMLNLTFQLLKLFAEGSLPATTVQIIAASAFEDGWGDGDPIARRLAGIGASGKFPGNALRDLMRLTKRLGIGDATPDQYYVNVKSARGGERQVGLFLPHEQLSILVEKHGIDAFRMSADGWSSGSGLGRLLQSWGDDPSIQVETRDVCAIGFHADGVSYTTTQRAGNSKSVLVAAWNVISAPQDAHRGRRAMFFALSKALCCQCGCEGCQCFGWLLVARTPC